MRGCRFEDEVLLLPDDELAFARRIVVEAHLAVCEPCASVEALVDRAEQALAEGAQEPLGVIDAALARLEPAPRRLRVWMAAGVVAAAALLVALSIRPSAPTPSVPPPSPPRARGAELPPPAHALPLAEMVRTGDPGEVAARVVREGAAGTALLAKLLGDPELVERAMSVAERAPSPWLAPHLAPLLSHETLAPRAARLLGSVGSDEDVPSLKAALDGPASVEAREALVAIGGSAAAAALARRLDEPGMLDALVRADARRGALELAAGPGRDEARSVLAKRRDRLLPELRRLAREGEPGALRALGWAKDEGSLPLLTRQARHPEAARALIEIGTEEALRAAFFAVSRGGSARCFDDAAHAEPFLLRIVDSGPFQGRQVALELLGRCGGGATVERLLRSDLPRSLVPVAIGTLGSIGDPRSLPRLREWAEERRFAAQAIRALGGIHTRDSARLLVRRLIDGRLRHEAARALGSMPAPVVVPVLLEHFDARHTRRVLATIAGADYGGSLKPWQRWWDSRS